MSMLRREVAIQEWSRDGKRLTVFAAEIVKTVQTSFIFSQWRRETKRNRLPAFLMMSSALKRTNQEHALFVTCHANFQCQKESIISASTYHMLFQKIIKILSKLKVSFTHLSLKSHLQKS